MNTEEKDELKTLEKPAQRILQNVKNNNHHIVPCGILIMVFTLYLTAASLRKNCDTHFEQSRASVEQQSQKESEFTVEDRRQSATLSRLREHENVCFDLAIFTKEWNTNLNEKPPSFEMALNETNVSVDVETAKGSQKRAKKSEKLVANGNGNGSSINSSNKIINNKSIKSKSAKQVEAKKKDTPKKNTTAEPIIYLFALVFIYLLLKAASDINQHYKSQTKGDKRLRRCSLQSYAQAHKQDRRASKVSNSLKDSPLHRKLKYLAGRSASADRLKRVIVEHDDELSLRSELLANMRKYTSLDEPTKPLVPTPPPASPFKRSQDFTKSPKERLVLDTLSPDMKRRGSMPVTINYQPILVTANPSRPLIRRTSMISANMLGQQLADPTLAPSADAGLFPEQKRRVRMINRH